MYNEILQKLESASKAYKFKGDKDLQVVFQRYFFIFN